MRITDMTENEQVTDDGEKGLFLKLKARGREWFSAVSRHCRDVETAKDACERQNLQKNGKDWVNRCCG
jgi:hypothetical protein